MPDGFDLASYPLRKYAPGDKYNYIHDNKPIEDIHRVLEGLTSTVNATRVEIERSRGTMPSLNDRLKTSTLPNGMINPASLNDPFDWSDPRVNDATVLVNSSAVVTVDGERMNGVRDLYMHLIDAHADSASYVRMRTSERVKLEGIEDGATRTRLRVDDEKYPLASGEVVLRSGYSIRLQQLGNDVYVHSLIPPESLHKHVYGERPQPSPATSRSANGTQVATSINGSVRSFITQQPYISGSLRVSVNGVRVDPIRIEEANPEGGLFRFQPWVKELPDEGRNDSLRVDYDVRVSGISQVGVPAITTVETFSGYGTAIPNSPRSTWKLRFPAIMNARLHQLFVNGIHYRMRSYPFDDTPLENFDWQLGNINGTIDGVTMVRSFDGTITSQYVVWLNPNVVLKPEDEITIYYVG